MCVEIVEYLSYVLSKLISIGDILAPKLYINRQRNGVRARERTSEQQIT